MAVGSALIAAALPYKGPGDDTAYAVLAVELLAGDAAVFVKLLQRDYLLMGGDLEHRVGRGVDDQAPPSA